MRLLSDETITYLFVKLNVSGLELLSDLFTSSKMVGELDVRQRLGSLSFVRSEVLRWGLRDGVQGYGNVLVVSNFLKMDMRDLVVVYFSGVVVNDVSR